jgi:hypothetical protein
LKSAITAHSFNTPFPELTDEGTMAKSASYNSLSFKIASFRSARVLYRLYGHLGPSEDPRFESVLGASDELEQIIDNLCPELQIANDDQPTQPVITCVRRFLNMTLAHRMYLIHRPYFIKSFRDRSFAKSHDACVQAASDIIMLAEKGLPSIYYRLWNTSVWLVAAGIVLALDLLHATDAKTHVPDAMSRRSTLTNLIELLCNSGDYTGIASRGAALISHLVRAEREIANGQRSGVKFSRAEIMSLVREPNKPSWKSQPTFAATSSTTTSTSTNHHFPMLSPVTATLNPVEPFPVGGDTMNLQPSPWMNGNTSDPSQMFMGQDDSILSFLDELFPPNN